MLEGNMKCECTLTCVVVPVSEVSDDTVVFKIMLHHLTHYQLSANLDAGLDSYLGERSQGMAQISVRHVWGDLITHVPL